MSDARDPRAGREPRVHAAPRRVVRRAALLACAAAGFGTGVAAAPQRAVPPQRPAPPAAGDSIGDGGPATAALLTSPIGVAYDRDRNLYIVERGAHRIRRVDARTGIITTVAGDGVDGYAGDGGPAARARLSSPNGIDLAPDGAIVFGDVFNDRIRRIDLRTGTITTLVGTGETGFGGDGGPAREARIAGPFGLDFDPAGNLYFTDTENHRIRRVDARTGIVTTVAGNGRWDFAGDGGPATEASLARPHEVLAEGDSALLIGDSFNLRIRRVDLRTGVITTIAGTGERGTGGDGGPARAAAFTYFGGIERDRHGDLLVSGIGDARIRRIDRRTGTITNFAGDGRFDFGGDGGPAARASFHLPAALLRGPDDEILVADMWNGRIRRIDGRTGIVTTVAGSAPSRPTPAVSWHFHYDSAAIRRALDVPVALAVPGMDRVRVLRDVDYRGDGRPRSRMNVYLPPAAGAQGRHPVVLLVLARNDSEIPLKDGGGFDSWGRLLAASGMVALVPAHRLGTRARSLEEGAADLAAALRHARERADAFGADPDRSCVLAFSSGAPLVAPLLDATPPPRCLVAFYPLVDLTRPLPYWARSEGDTARARFSIAGRIERGAVPTLIAAAGRDDAAVAEPLRELERRTAGRAEVVFLAHPDGGHEFERSAPADEPGRSIVRRALAFLREHLAAH